MMRFAWLGLIFLVAVVSAEAQEWSRFRGPNGTGLSPAATIPVTWTEKDFNWKVTLPGKGHSSPVVWGDRIFVTSGESKTGKRWVICVSAAEGKTLWSRDFDSKSYKMHRRNSVATATPTVDERHVYLSWATPDQLMAMALDHQGKTVWQKELGPYPSQHGYGVSPIRFEELLIVPNEQDGGGSLVALDAGTGKERWKVTRQGKNATYSTPCIYQPANRPAELIFTNWQHGITAIDPRTGNRNWEISVFDTDKPERSIASPVVAGDLVLGTCGFVSAQKHFVAVRPDGNGHAKEVWRIEKAVSYLPTPLVKGDWIFLCSELGIASCVQAATGKVLWQERLGGTYSASPVCAGDHIYCVADDGNVVVLAASDTFQVLGRNTLGEATQSTPAIANGRMIFRTESHLISLGGAK